MDALKIPLASVTGFELEVDAVVSGKDLQPEDAIDLNLGDVAVKGTLQEMGEEYLFRGTVSGHYRGACDRCLEPMEIPFALDVIWDFVPGPELQGLEEFTAVEDEDADVFGPESNRTFDGNDINLAASVWEEIVLALPIKFLCKSNCQGLCPQCGTNLNLAECSCQAVEAEPEIGNSFAGLRDLFPDLRDENPEE